MKLHNKVPTVPGWYWIKGPFYKEPWIVQVYRGAQDLLIHTSLPIRGYAVNDQFLDGWLWSDPIPYPEKE